MPGGVSRRSTQTIAVSSAEITAELNVVVAKAPPIHAEAENDETPVQLGWNSAWC